MNPNKSGKVFEKALEEREGANEEVGLHHSDVVCVPQGIHELVEGLPPAMSDEILHRQPW